MNFRRTLSRIFHREQDLDDEIRFHLRMAESERIERGEDVAEARRASRREFGNEILIREVTREMWGYASLGRFRQDVVYAFRTLRRNPVFSLTAIVSLALGIGANTATFSISDAILLRPLAIPEADRVMVLKTQTPQEGLHDLAFAEWEDLRLRGTLFEGVAAWHLRGVALALPSEVTPRWRMGMAVSDGFFSALGPRIAQGRAFFTEEMMPASPGPVVMLSDQFWRTQFGAEDNVLGTTVSINGTAHTVIGIVAPEFTGVDTLVHPAFYVPLAQANPEDRETRNLHVLARLRPGVSRQNAEAELAVYARSLAEAYPASNKDRQFVVLTQLQDRINQSVAVAAVSAMLMALSLLLLVVACANVAGLLLARARARVREMAVRISIGAGRARLIRQLLTESFVLAVLGAAGGVATGYFAIRFVAAIQIPTDTPIAIQTQLDIRVLMVCLAVSCLSVLFFGLVPAWQASRPDPAYALKSGDPSDRKRNRAWGRSILVVAQVACSVVLLIASSAFLDGFRRMLLADPGIRTEGLMMIEFDPSTIGYSEAQTQQFYRRLIDEVRAEPGVLSAALSRCVPFRPNFTDEPVMPEGYDFGPGRDSVSVSANSVDEHYFETVGTPILQGRPFHATDDIGTRPVAIVSEEFASRFFAGRDAIGSRFRYGKSRSSVEVVGVARNAKVLSLAEAPQPYFYLPFRQSPRTRMTLFVHTESDPRQSGDRLIRLVQSVDPNQPVFNTRPFQTFYELGALGPSRAALQMVGATGVVGLVLALVGIYGLVSFNVVKRTREIGVRMAVGATRFQVLAFVLRQALAIAVWGCAIGVGLGFFVFRGISASLAGLGGLSPLTLVLVPAGLIAMTLLACCPAALRAASINPVSALRSE